LHALTEQPEVFGGAAPFDIGAVFAEKRLVPLALESGDFHVIRMKVDFNLGAKSGDIIFAFPVAVEPPVEAPIIALDDARSPRDILGDGRVSLRAVLHRVTMPYSALRDLKVGDCVNIPRNAPRQMRLEAEGRVVARGMLATTPRPSRWSHYMAVVGAVGQGLLVCRPSKRQWAECLSCQAVLIHP